MTWLDPASGWEVSGALGITFSAENSATRYQTAPEAHLEGTVMRHLPSKLALGLTGYVYHQTGEDSGAGADAFRARSGVETLQVSVAGLGPIMTYSTRVADTAFSLKAKYVKQFDAQSRFQSDTFWLTVGLVF